MKELTDAERYERFIRPRLAIIGECHFFTGARRKGYGLVWHQGKTQQAHRVAYAALVGPIPDGTELDHKCRHLACCNTEHLEPVAHVVNVHRGNIMLKGVYSSIRNNRLNREAIK